MDKDNKDENKIRNTKPGGWLAEEEEASLLFAKRVLVPGYAYAYKRVMKKGHVNLPVVHAVEKEEDGSRTVIEEQFNGIPLTELWHDGLNKERVEDIITQLCDALHFLAARKKPLFHHAITQENIILGKSDVIKLTRLELADTQGSVSDSIRQIGLLLEALGEPLRKRYQKVIGKCKPDNPRAFTSYEEVAGAVALASRASFVRWTAGFGFVLIILFLLIRIMFKLLKNN